jgi:fido (protein-threonine AMPylation protein)
MSEPFPPGDRTYYVSDERLRAFMNLTPEQKLRWVEELATFLRLAKIDREKPQDISKQS